MAVPAVHDWPTNGHLLVDVEKLYFKCGDAILDCTYGLGVFWREFGSLDYYDFTASDIDPAKSPFGRSVDFTAMPWIDDVFDVVVFDPPYKLNGTPSAPDERYGVDTPTGWRDRVALMEQGLSECARVVKKRGIVLVKCQDQVVSNQVVWQTDIMTEHGRRCGLSKIDRFDLTGTTRKQPRGRRQIHAHGRPSTLLVFRKDK